MPYSRPELTDINTSVLQDIQAAGLPGVDGLLQRAVLRVLALSMAGLAQEHYGYQDWTSRQATPFTATGEHLYGWGGLKGVTLKPATTAVLQAQFAGAVGTVLPGGTGANTANALAFVSMGDAVIGAGGALTVNLTASGSGTSYNLAIGTTLSLSNGIAGISSSGTVTAVITTAADQETDDEFRTRMLQVYANPPQGGAQSDYVTWALAVPGITRAWCNPGGAGAGTVVVYPMLDDANAASGGFPQGTDGVASSERRGKAATGDQLTVANAIYPLRPATAEVHVVSAIPLPIPFTIANLSPNTAAMLTAIQSVLTNMFFRLGSPLGMTLYPSDCDAALLSVSGIGHFTLASPASPVVIPVGYLPEMGIVTVSG